MPSYIELPRSEGRPISASFMVPNVPSYLAYNQSAFVSDMSKVISYAVTDVNSIQLSGSANGDRIREVLNKIAVMRKRIAINAGDEGSQLFGKALTKERGPRDLIPNDEEHRHYYYLDRARNAYENGVQLSVSIPAGLIECSKTIEDGHKGYEIQHPTKQDCEKLSAYAFENYSELFNGKVTGEQNIISVIAKCTYLLMHGTPFVRGTPACVQALNDAIVRILIGKTFPRFKDNVEPFWEAIFLREKTFIANYRDYFRDE
ncbi:MAG: hypothetical protein COC20_01530 [Cellvibrionales bacterium]|nr:MAG: hypothetical protein COC20_01530 [Cellvibrionales bacterium]